MTEESKNDGRPQPPDGVDPSSIARDGEVAADNSESSETPEPSAAPSTTAAKPHKKLTRAQEQLIRKVAGIACIVVAVAALAIGICLFYSESLPAWSYGDSSSVYRYDNLEKTQADIDAYKAQLQDPNISADDERLAKQKLKVSEDFKRTINTHALQGFLMMVGALPSIALFIVWLVLAIKTRDCAGSSLSTKRIVRNVIMFVIFGFMFFNLLPGIIVDFVANIKTIALVVVVVVIMIACAKSGIGEGSSSFSGGSSGGSGSSSGGGSGGGSSSSKSGTSPSKKMSKRDKIEEFEQGGRVDVREVPSNLPLKRVETTLWGRAIAYAGADDEDHYVCTQDEFDKGKFIIVDQKGNKRSV